VLGVLHRYAEENVTDHDFALRAELFPVDTPGSEEELLYRRIFEGLFPSDKMRHLVQRWRRDDGASSTTAIATATDTGDRTYRQTVAHGFYGRFEGCARSGRNRLSTYLSTYASLSHLSTEDFEHLLRDVAQHAKSGSLLVLDLMGRYSPEWPRYWSGATESDRYREYSMSYLYDPGQRKPDSVERFRIRFWTRSEVDEVCRRLSTSSCRLKLERTVDRSLFVGRRIDTGEHGTTLPPLRGAVNRLHEPHVRTELSELELSHSDVSGFSEQNRIFGELAAAWNTLIRFASERLSGKRITLPSLAGWSAFPDARSNHSSPTCCATSSKRFNPDSGTGTAYWAASGSSKIELASTRDCHPPQGAERLPEQSPDRQKPAEITGAQRRKIAPALEALASALA
jgi:hypothetical protein